MGTGRIGDEAYMMVMPDNPDRGMLDNDSSLVGLTEAEVRERRTRFGENRLPGEKGVSVWKILLSQFMSPLVYIILVAALVSLALGEYGDFGIIMLVVVTDVILGFIQEYQAQKTYVALKGLLRPTTTVVRDGMRREVDVWELVPDDLVILNAGEKVPGDGTLLEATRMSLDESILTGESEPVLKQARPTGSTAAAAGAPANTAAGAPTGSAAGASTGATAGSAAGSDLERDRTAYMGTTVLTGRGLLRIDRTGTGTELGQIAASLGEQPEADTPFQVRLKAFSKVLTRIVVGFTAVIMLAGLIMGREFFDMLRTAIILAIAAVPEGLLIAVTVILVLGMRKILKRQGLVKKLLAVETLGAVTVICTDKTGTLTEGRMRVNRTELADEQRALQTMIFCNNLEGPVDIALWQYAEQTLQQEGGPRPQALADQTVRLAEELFSSETKFMTALVTGGLLAESRIHFLKGAPEIVMAMCDLADDRRAPIMANVNAWADEGLRLLGLAFRFDGPAEAHLGFCWAGLVGMDDPVRDGVVASIRAARHAGIDVKMITGDYRRTAQHIAAAIGLMDAGGQVLEGEEIARLSDEDLRGQVRQTAIFARIRPQDKYRIVKALQANGEITAMIGDGVNDAPALKRANIGVVVGSATDVAKETADLILLDSHFGTIVAAIEEGRIIFANIRKVVAYTLSNSFAEVLTIFIAMLLKWPPPLLVAQILWIHLICDGPSDIVLGFEPKEDGLMDEKPRSPKEPILIRLAMVLIAVISIASAIFTLYLFNHIYQVHQSAAEGRSVVFASFAINSMVYIFAYRSMRLPLHRMNPLRSNPPLVLAVIAGLLTAFAAFLVPGLRTLLGLVPLTLEEWILVFGFAVALLLIVEAGKWIAGRHQAGPPTGPDVQ